MSQIPDSRFLHARGGMDITGIRQRMERRGTLASFDYPAEEPNEPDRSGHGGPGGRPVCVTFRAIPADDIEVENSPTLKYLRLRNGGYSCF